MKPVVMFLIRCYQAVLSPFFYGTCRFHPTCSHYAVEAVETHGTPRGLWLAVRRIFRCHPFCHGGFDPVPPAKHASKTIFRRFA